ncbi:hypothetical protein WKK05_30865 [Nostoc sp. UHCC 0302]|uniref:hypothetical protein n=1 Tax=Nostoc sp. UHCC 0302 TaxID=3134896 RepID=UPI00311CDF2B
MPKNRLTKNYFKIDPFIQHFFARIPPQTAATFTHTQLAELKKVFGNRAVNRHAVDVRLSIPFIKKRFYIVFLLGKEKRLKRRL